MDTTVLAALITSTSSIIAALIALGATLISLRVSKKSPSVKRESTVSGTKPIAPEQPVTPSKRKSKILVIRILLPVVISTIIGGVLGYSFIAVPVALSPCGLFASTSVTITSPEPNSRVPNQVTVQGTACHISQDKELWLLVQVNGVRGYFPQPGPIVVSSDGTWSVPANIGSDTDSGRGFTLIPALVDQNDKAAKDAIQTFFMQPGPVYVPIEPLPSGIQLLPSQVHVIRI